MTESMICWRCRKEFIPGTPYEFPTYTAYWHVCPSGVMTMVSVPNQKKQWWDKPERTTEENLNHKIEEYDSFRIDPLEWYRKFHANIRSDNQWGRY